MKLWEIHEKIRLDAASQIWDSMRDGHRRCMFSHVVGSELRGVRLAMREMKDEMIRAIEGAMRVGINSR